MTVQEIATKAIRVYNAMVVLDLQRLIPWHLSTMIAEHTPRTQAELQYDLGYRTGQAIPMFPHYSLLVVAMEARRKGTLWIR